MSDFNRPPIRFGFRRQARPVYNVHGGNNNGANAAAARRAENERKRRASLNRHKFELQVAAASAHAAQLGQASNAELARNVRGTVNRLANGNASQSQVRRIIEQLRHNPEARRRVGFAVLVSLFVAAGYITVAMRAMASRGNKKNALFNFNVRRVR